MKTFLTTTILPSLIFSLALISTGCSQKPAILPDADINNNTATNEQIAETAYTENNIPTEGSLDDTSTENLQTGNLSVNTAAEQTDEDKYLRGRSSIELKPVYFDFDKAVIKEDMVENMTVNAEYLTTNPTVSIVIEGNCDKKGTNEYNLALGERRAISAMKYLVNLGVDEKRIRTVSYGEERPLFDNDAAKNRRDDFIIE